VLQDGIWNGTRIVPADWIALSTAASAPTAPGAEGYGYQWWIPSAVRPVRLGSQPVSEAILHAVLAFSFMYMVIIVLVTLLLSLTGLEMVTAFSAVVACLNNTGPGLNAVGPASNYQGLTDFQTWVLAFTMIIGRLEIFTLLVVLTPAFWRK
jgi:trk system potassium uptake protein TrkH